MTTRSSINPDRRRLITQLSLLSVSGLLPAGVMARTKSSQAAMQYQDSPKNGRKCADCMHFIAPASDGQPGQCKVVEGEIAAQGYCIAWAARS